MSRPLLITEHQTRVIIRAAKKEGVRQIDMRIGSTVITMFPEDAPTMTRPVDDDEVIAL